MRKKRSNFELCHGCIFNYCAGPHTVFPIFYHCQRKSWAFYLQHFLLSIKKAPRNLRVLLRISPKSPLIFTQINTSDNISHFFLQSKHSTFPFKYPATQVATLQILWEHPAHCTLTYQPWEVSPEVVFIAMSSVLTTNYI